MYILISLANKLPCILVCHLSIFKTRHIVTDDSTVCPPCHSSTISVVVEVVEYEVHSYKVQLPGYTQ